MFGVLDEWETFGHRYRLCHGHVRSEGWTPLDPSDARWVLQARFAAPEARKALYGRFHGSGAAPANLGEPQVLEREVEQRRLVVLEQGIAALRLGASAPEEPPAPVPREPEPARKRGWIDIVVVDDSTPARALIEAGFRLRLPDHSTREGALDGQGRVYLDEIEPGRCWIELTDPGRGIEP